MDAEPVLSKYLKQAVKSATEEVAEHARNHHGFTARTGNLERSIVGKISSDGLRGFVTIDRTTAPYGVYIHQGYKAYDIVPRNKLALRWVAGIQKVKFNGKSVNKRTFAFAKRVHHPAYKGDPFLFNALDAKSAYITKVFDNHIEAALKEIAEGL